MVQRFLVHMGRHPILVSGLSIRLLAGVLSQLDFFLGRLWGHSFVRCWERRPWPVRSGLSRRAGRRRASRDGHSREACRCSLWDAVRNL